MAEALTCIREINNDEFIRKTKKNIKLNAKYLNNESKIFALLGSAVRFKIIYLLLNYKKLCVCDFSDILEMKQSPISQHLRKLKDAGILENEREKLAIFYFISDSMKEKLQVLVNNIYQNKKEGIIEKD